MERSQNTLISFSLEMGFALTVTFAPDAGEPAPDYIDLMVASYVFQTVIEDVMDENALDNVPKNITAITEEVASMPALGGYLYNARKGPDQAIMEAADWMVNQLPDNLKARIVDVFEKHSYTN